MSAPRSRSVLVWIAGGALLLAMVVDALAMLGRQVQLPLLGAIEIVQACVLFAACGALIVAAADRAHARVHLLLDRLPPVWRTWARKLHALAEALFYAALLSGSVWIAADLWNGREESELLRIPYRPLRVAVVLTMAALLAHALVRLWRSERDQ
jgi:TRAP-type C4-dicarboxylate transport system permease small subunit